MARDTEGTPRETRYKAIVLRSVFFDSTRLGPSTRAKPVPATDQRPLSGDHFFPPHRANQFFTLGMDPNRRVGRVERAPPRNFAENWWGSRHSTHPTPEN